MIRKTIILISAALMPLFAVAQNQEPVLFGTMVNGGDENLPLGVYSMPVTPEGFGISPVKADNSINASHGAMTVGNELHFISELSDGTLLYNRYSRADWQPIGEPEQIDADFNTADLLYDEVDETVYGCFYGKNSTNENPDRQSYSLIGKTELGCYEWELMTEMAAIEDVMALGMNVNGALFSVGTMGGMWHIDQTNGVTIYSMMTPSYDYMIKKDTQYALVFDPEEPYIAYLLCVMRGKDDGTWQGETKLWKLEPQLRQRTLVGTLPKGVEFSSLWFATDIETGITEYRSVSSQPFSGVSDFSPIYDLSGRLVAASSQSAGKLPAGIYISNGKKIAVK